MVDPPASLGKVAAVTAMAAVPAVLVGLCAAWLRLSWSAGGAIGVLVGLGTRFVSTRWRDDPAELLRVAAVGLVAGMLVLLFAWIETGAPVAAPLRGFPHPPGDDRGLWFIAFTLVSLFFVLPSAAITVLFVRALAVPRVVRLIALMVAAIGFVVVVASARRLARPTPSKYVQSLPVIATVVTRPPSSPPWEREPDSPEGARYRLALDSTANLMLTPSPGLPNLQFDPAGSFAPERQTLLTIDEPISVRRDRPLDLWFFVETDGRRVQIVGGDGVEHNGLSGAAVAVRLGPGVPNWILALAGQLMAMALIAHAIRWGAQGKSATVSTRHRVAADEMCTARLVLSVSVSLVSAAPLAAYVIHGFAI